jgi:methylenetetrahydrofolate reductase (NADPH)
LINNLAHMIGKGKASMPIFSPRRFQSAYLPVEQDEEWLVRFFTALERPAKGLLFGCRMCGNCILQETAFVCPMTCAKGLRNGFCGEATEEHCVVDSSRACTWLRIYRRAERMGRLEKLLEINAPINGAKAGHSAWLPFAKFWSEREQPRLADLVINPQKFLKGWDGLCFEFRQPEWWQGDAEYHAPASREPVSRLEGALRTRPFIITTEVEPPEGCTPGEVIEKCQALAPYVVSINFSDNAFATSRMSSLACSKLCLESGGEAVLQIQARDRSRNGIVSDVIGAAAMGVRNILCLGGDYHNKSPEIYPVQPNQFDIDAVQMLWMLRRLRDEGRLADGREVEDRPGYFLGAAGAPFTLKPEYSALRLEKKINAGAQFIQTQMVFDIPRFEAWVEACEKRSLLDKAALLVGVYPLRNAEDAHLMDMEPGITIPEDILKRMDAAAEKDRNKSAGSNTEEFQEKESHQITRELFERLRTLPGIRGIHLMAGGQENVVPLLLE